MSAVAAPYVWLGVVLTGASAALLVAPRPLADTQRPAPPPATGPAPATPSQVRRVLSCLLAGVGVWLFLGGWLGAVLGVSAAVTYWRVLVTAEPADVRRRREQTAAELPHLVGLVAAGLRAGSPPDQALAAACSALPGPAADCFAASLARLELGVDPGTVWSDLAGQPEVSALGRTLSRSHQTGASVLEAIGSLAQNLAQESRARVEDRARTVGVRAALPLGLCLLPAFLLVGIVPVVVGMAAELSWS